jgi:hypothetical protein
MCLGWPGKKLWIATRAPVGLQVFIYHRKLLRGAQLIMSGMETIEWMVFDSTLLVSLQPLPWSRDPQLRCQPPVMYIYIFPVACPFTHLTHIVPSSVQMKCNLQRQNSYKPHNNRRGFGPNVSYNLFDHFNSCFFLLSVLWCGESHVILGCTLKYLTVVTFWKAFYIGQGLLNQGSITCICCDCVTSKWNPG